MPIDESLRDAWMRKQEQRGRGSGGPGGGGFDSGLEARVAKVEAHIEHLAADLRRLVDVPTKLGVLEERIAHLPTKGWMVASLGTALAVIAALIAFSEKIHLLVR